MTRKANQMASRRVTYNIQPVRSEFLSRDFIFSKELELLETELNELICLKMGSNPGGLS